MTRYVHGFARILAQAALAAAVLSGPAAAQTPLLQVEKSDATKLMQVNDDAGLVVSGTIGAGTIPAEGAGVRFMWYPGKAALRASQADGTEWDDANVGTGSVAFGEANRDRRQVAGDWRWEHGAGWELDRERERLEDHERQLGRSGQPGHGRRILRCCDGQRNTGAG